jgi:pyruvate,water dikinase
LLQDGDLKTIWRTLLQTESLIGNAVDLEWTGRGTEFTVLQARPISTVIEDESEARSWYLSLRPAAKRLKALSQRVTGVLIPELEAVGRDFASERLTGKGDAALADALGKRWEAVKYWRKVYREEFIPFAHGVRQLALYYNDRVCPEDPYEFVGLLEGENLLALQRNRRLAELAMHLRANPELIDAIKTAADPVLDESGYQKVLEQARTLPGGLRFVAGLEELLRESMDVTYGAQRMAAHPGHLLRHLYALSRVDAGHRKPARELKSRSSAELEARLFSAVGPEDRAGAEEILAIGRLSWRLRDDDNILLARLEAQLLDTLDMAVKSLSESGRVDNNGNTVSEQDISILLSALRDPQRRPIVLSEPKEPARERGKEPQSEKPRQLLGQPAAPGTATGLVRIVDGMDDLRHFQAGDVLVCRAIEPTMTHLVPLARAIIELRGGMLIHGAIIARELGIPCVNGIAEVVTLLNNGDLVTVDGYLGIVTVGAPEFDLEKVTPEARLT